MREGVPDTWLKELLKVQGSVEFILVYPPHVSYIPITDPRLRQITSSLRGEVIQRVTALLNASGKYVLSINCDEYIHSNIVAITEDYFSNFPDSYFFRLQQVLFPFGYSPIDKPWGSLPNIKDIQIRKSNSRKTYSEAEIEQTMREIPITPLNKKLDFLDFLGDVEITMDLIKKILTKKFGKISWFRKHSRVLYQPLRYSVLLNMFLFGRLTG
jgi:hypothetical protein